MIKPVTTVCSTPPRYSSLGVQTLGIYLFTHFFSTMGWMLLWGALSLQHFLCLYSYSGGRGALCSELQVFPVGLLIREVSASGILMGCWLRLSECVWEGQGRTGNEWSIRKWASGGLMFWFLLNLPQRFQKRQGIGLRCLVAYTCYLRGGYRQENKFVAQCWGRVYKTPDQSEILTRMLVNL